MSLRVVARRKEGWHHEMGSRPFCSIFVLPKGREFFVFSRIDH